MKTWNVLCIEKHTWMSFIFLKVQIELWWKNSLFFKKEKHFIKLSLKSLFIFFRLSKSIDKNWKTFSKWRIHIVIFQWEGVFLFFFFGKFYFLTKTHHFLCSVELMHWIVISWNLNSPCLINSFRKNQFTRWKNFFGLHSKRRDLNKKSWLSRACSFSKRIFEFRFLLECGIWWFNFVEIFSFWKCFLKIEFWLFSFWALEIIILGTVMGFKAFFAAQSYFGPVWEGKAFSKPFSSHFQAISLLKPFLDNSYWFFLNFSTKYY